MGKQRQSWYGSGGHGGRAPTATPSAITLQNGAHYHPHTHEEEPSSTSAGCMCAVFQLFDFYPLNQHHHHPPQSPVSLKPVSLPPDDHISTGTEAPRNSLESDEELPLSCTTAKQKEDGLHIPKGIVQIKTRSRRNESPSNDGENSNDYFSGNSPSTKTPTLVARLMGLDLLPQTNSPVRTPRTASASPIYPLVPKPKSRHCLAQNNHLIGSRSLPETPRTSCERKSNVDNYHHRFSLQIPNYDKENASPSPGHYTKEIVKHIKETVSRKAGLDITNYTGRDHEVIIQTKPKKVLSSSATSPRLRVLEPKNLNKPDPQVETSKASGTKPKQKAKTKPQPPVQIPTDDRDKQKGTKMEINETFGHTSRVTKKANKQEEPFVIPSRITKATIDGPRKKSKKTPLSNDLLSFSSVPTVLMKKGPPFSSAKPPQIQSPCNRNQPAETGDKESKRFLQSSSFQNQPHKTMHDEDVIQQPKNKHHIRDAAAAISTTASDCPNTHDITADVEYVRQILGRTSSPVYSVLLESNSEVAICLPSDRKLLCHLVEELLKPYVEMRSWVGGGCRQTAEELWAEVVEKLCEKVRSYPRAKCEVLEDIDGIIEKDMDRMGMRMGCDCEEEGEGIVEEIEEGIVEELLKETVAFVG